MLERYIETKWNLESLDEKRALQNRLQEYRIDVRKRDIEEWHQLTGGGQVLYFV
jgi:hypothetical protein